MATRLTVGGYERSCVHIWLGGRPLLERACSIRWDGGLCGILFLRMARALEVFVVMVVMRFGV